LNSSIFSHTQSDVGYNIQLSGGLDSSFITAVLNRQYNQKLDTFSVKLKGFDKDESPYQEFVSQKFNTIHHSHSFSGADFTNNIIKATWHMDMPLIHGAGVFLMMLCKYSQRNSKVILTGEGADELFGGYGRYRINNKDKFIFLIKRLGISGKFFPNLSIFNKLKNLLNREWDGQIIHSPEKMDSLIDVTEPDLFYRRMVSGKFDDLLRKIIASDQTSYLQSLLERQDKFSMAMSVETRVPFSTYKLFDYINDLNYVQKVKNEPKIILKNISKKYFPNNFIFRPKIGFILPYAEWFRDRTKTRKFMDILTDNTFKDRGFYNYRKVSNLVDEHLYKDVDNSKYLMNLINFEIWHRIFIDKSITV
jgi:asparagine synthase (glutamine-hydrolysing)